LKPIVDVRQHDEDASWTWGAGAAVVVIIAGILKISLVEWFNKRRGESEREPNDD
jgi:hypothetical protein